jgi:addiction module RelE/StbE family toxin
MKSVVWSTRAEESLEEIVDYISIDNIEAAMELARTIVHTSQSHVSSHPHMGRVGQVKNTRELVVHKNYIVIYQIQQDAIEILDIVHAARLHFNK